MHAAFVQWADESNAGSDRGREFEEILGYHLEQAYRYLGELGPIDDAGAAIGRDGAQRLTSAGRRAFGRGDMHAAANLLLRAAALYQHEDVQRAELLPELAEIHLSLGDFPKARELLMDARSSAERIGNLRLRASSQLIEMLMGAFAGEHSEPIGEKLPTPSDLIPLLESEDANDELALAWRLVVMKHGIAGRYELARQAAEQSARYARLAGNERLVTKIAMNLADLALLGPTPVKQGIDTCERLISDGLGDRQVEARIMCKLAHLRAMNGELNTARKLYQQGRAMLEDLGKGLFIKRSGIMLAHVELLGDDFAAAEDKVRVDYEALKKAGDNYSLATIAALLARLVREQGRDAEALELSEVAEAASGRDDQEAQASWRSTRAPIVARSGQLDLAQRLATEAVELMRQTEAPVLQADALVDLATVLQIAGKGAEARSAIDEAVALYAAKGHVVSEVRAKEMAEELSSSA